MKVVRRFVPALAALATLVAAAPAAATSVREVPGPNVRAFHKPGCPSFCEAIGQVTGYQVQIGKAKNPYLIRRKGKIVAFTVALGKPNRRQTRFFTNLFAPTPKVRLSILKPQRRGRLAKLVAQSGTFNVQPYLGSTPTFGLKEALPVPRRSIVAITTSTWVPAFAVKLKKGYAWRSSRSSTACEDVQQPAAHQAIGTIRSYGCFYRTARLLYSATFVPDPKPTTKPKP
jgi:hypothetical protein